MFKIISICNGGGYKYCRTLPLHPKANSNGLYPLHRVKMENKLGRILKKHEVVHHKNGNKNDNSAANLEVLSNNLHTKLHLTKEAIKVYCTRCDKEFSLKEHVLRQRLIRNKKKLFCSLHCSTKYFYKK